MLVLASGLQSPTVMVKKSDHRRLNVSILHLWAFILVYVSELYISYLYVYIPVATETRRHGRWWQGAVHSAVSTLPHLCEGI